MPFSASFGESFPALVRRIVLHEKRWPAAAIAPALGLTTAALYARIRGDGRFAPDEIAVLLRETGDDRLARWLFAGTRIVLVKLPKSPHEGGPVRSLEQVVATAAANIIALLDLLGPEDARAADSQSAAPPEAFVDRAIALLLSLKLPDDATPGTDSSAVQPEHRESFASLVNRILLTERGVRLRDLADGLGLGYHAMHARLSGRSRFDPEDVRRLLRLYPDLGLADFFVLRTPFVAMLSPDLPLLPYGYGGMRAGLACLQELVGLLNDPPESTGHPADLAGAGRTGRVQEALRHLLILRWSLQNVGSQDVKWRKARRDALQRGVLLFQALDLPDGGLAPAVDLIRKLSECD